jgi:uncharacterized membrane protein (Fun14 family)
MGAVPLFYTCKISRYSRLVPGYPCIISWWKVSHISRTKFLFRGINHFNSQASRNNILCMPGLIAFSFSNEFHAFFLTSSSTYRPSRVVKFASIIVGLFVLGLAFLSYRGRITASWNTIQDQTQSFAYNASVQVLHMVNDTASKFAVHPLLAHAEATPISAAIGFTASFVLGIWR